MGVHVLETGIFEFILLKFYILETTLYMLLKLVHFTSNN